MWKMTDYMISTDKTLLDFDIMHTVISTESYWGVVRSQEVMAKAINNSAYCFDV
jgi:hypothetical protein